MAKPVELDNGTLFKTQSEAKKYFKSILNSSNSDVTITTHDEEFSNILALYKRHPEFHWKTANIAQIKEFIIKDSGQFHTRCFHVIHHDGSIADWSYLSALSTQLKSQFECFIDGAKNLLESSSYRFRDENFKKKCADFIISRGFAVDNFPSEWVSKPGKLQYRSSLTISISKDFINWYKQND